MYLHLANIFRHRIDAGEWPAGTLLPPFERLADEFSVARGTVRQAIQLLVAEGRLSATRGRGTEVLSGPPAGTPNRRAAGDITRGQGTEKVKVLSVGEPEPLPADLRTAMPVDEAFVPIRKVHEVRRRPYSYNEVWVAESVFDRLPKGAIRENNILFEITVRLGHAIGTVQQSITVEPCDMAKSGLLACHFSTPLARIDRVFTNPENRIFSAGRVWYVGESFLLDMTIKGEWIKRSPELIVPRVPY